jgi:hypothetical protein
MPPCVLSAVGPAKASTFVAKVDAFGPLQAFGATALIRGAGGFAQVILPGGECYFVLTGVARQIPQASAKIAADIQKLPSPPAVEWVRPLTVRLQRLFGWGDVTATRQDVERAVAKEDAAELRAILPHAARLIDDEDPEMLSALPDAFDAARGVLAIEDAPDPEHLYARHEALGLHVWSTEANRKSICARCERNSPHECECGCRRCKACIDTPSPLAPETRWQQHPTAPLPFYVIDNVKLADAEKLAWIRHELGADADIGTFAAKFLDLFGGRIRGTFPQKAACLKLFAAYSGSNWAKECDIPPADRELFIRAWGEEHGICRECGGTASGLYCSRECETAGATTVCVKCKASLDPWYPHCSECSVGNGPSEGLLAYRDRVCAPGSLEAAMQRQVEALALANRVWMSERACVEGHEPAWKRRRRA